MRFHVNRKCVLAWYKNIDEGTYASADNEHICWWWLRSPGDFEDAACGVGYYGSVSPFYFVNYTCYDYEGDYCEGSAGVRPALYVDLKS